MKKLLTPFGSFILILATVVCTMGAVISAFDFQVSWPFIVFVWAITALAAVVLFSFLRIKGLLILMIPIFIAAFFVFPEIIAGARWSMFYISTEFNRWLFVSVLFEDTSIYANELTIFFSVLGVVLTFLMSIAICLRRSALLTILFTVPFLALTFVIIFNQSAPGFLIGLIAVYLTMILSSSLSPDSFSGRGQAVFPAVLLAAILMFTAIIIAPPGDHDRGDFIRRVDNQIRAAASRAGIARIRTGIGWPVLHGGAWGFDTDNVSISSAGTRNIYDVSLLEVTVSSPGIFYLRGYSMQYFDGNSWTVNCDNVLEPHEDFLPRAFPEFISLMYAIRNPERAPEMVHMTISVTGDVTRNIIYTPYFAAPVTGVLPPYDFDFFHVSGSILDLLYDTAQLFRYGFTHSEFLTNFTYINALINSPDTYLQINEYTALALQQFAQRVGIDASASRDVIANQVASFMTGFGRYTLSPFIIPVEEDFVMYFLETSQHGFCIHYATAATMMLRALDVPARFASGFIVTVMPDYVGVPIDITDRYAHAWVEVFFDDVGWLPLEVTPPATGFGFGYGPPGIGIGALTSPLLGWYYDEPDFVDWWAEFEEGFEPNPDFALPESGTAGADGANYSPLVQIALIALILLLVISAPFVHRNAKKRIRAKHFTADDTNLSVVFAWRYLEKLKHFRYDYTIPIGVEDIAMKARYSQHTISEKERLAVITFVNGFADETYTKNSGLKLFFIKYVRGL